MKIKLVLIAWADPGLLWLINNTQNSLALSATDCEAIWSLTRSESNGLAKTQVSWTRFCGSPTGVAQPFRLRDLLLGGCVAHSLRRAVLLTAASLPSRAPHRVFPCLTPSTFSQYLLPYRIAAHRRTNNPFSTPDPQLAVSRTAAPLPVRYRLSAIFYLHDLRSNTGCVDGRSSTSRKLYSN